MELDRSKEIKFRAWDIKSKIMIDWNTINQTAFNTFNKLFEYNYYQKNYANDENLKYKNLFSTSLLYTIFHDPNFILMQFTCLPPDINGKDIYFGDKVKVIPDCSDDMAEYSQYDGWIISDRDPMYISLISPDGKDAIPLFSFEYTCRLEVIGHIYEEVNNV